MRGEEAAAAVPVPEAGRDGEQSRPPAGLGCAARGEPGGGGPQESRKQWKTFLYCEPHKRIKEVLEEELYIKRDECHIKHPPTGQAASTEVSLAPLHPSPPCLRFSTWEAFAQSREAEVPFEDATASKGIHTSCYPLFLQ
ncbi:uncharacterized protein C11orf97 homolog isoform X1 [Moschus berezovskii]|uniref:uncharacterized protein C11orf97 homolog isoform X1 n=1 Tax=Moschus berezovskii TaxID=68408 RepID=UPI002444A5A8|nr:uncharacterized protein C11orf97 homolog isoform X1 [Moschus berezovskii]